MTPPALILAQHTITDVSVEWPSAAEVWQTLTLNAGYNTTVVILGAALLGIAAGVIGAFAMLRKRALMGDVLAHCTLPGIGIAFMVSVALGGAGKSIVVLLPGAAISGVLGVIAVQAITRHTRLREDVAMGSVLSVFFGLGIVLMSVIQSMASGNQGGLDRFIYGQTAAMLASDAIVIGVSALVIVVACGLLLKEFALVCFDSEYAAVQGWPVSAIDLAMMSLVVLVTVIGLQAVGLILIVAMLIIPAASARFWSDRLWVVVVASGAIGGASGYLGSAASALLPRLPAGAVIVLTAGLIFAVSLLAAPKRGVVAEAVRGIRLRVRIGRDHLMRSMYELLELGGLEVEAGEAVPLAGVRAHWHWSPWGLRLSLFSARLSGFIDRRSTGAALTPAGVAEATRVTRSHRLWEQYLISYADLAASHVDFSADIAEHALSKEIVAELEASLRERSALPSRLPDHTELLSPDGAGGGGGGGRGRQLSEPMYELIAMDLPPLLAGVFVAISCGLLGNFLVLRKMSMMGDAISHAVLPGIVGAFVVMATRSAGVMFLGALMSGLVTVALIGLVRRVGRVEAGAAMGVVFSVLFALGVVLMEQAAARHVDLDPDCVLMGQMELLWWFPPSEWSALFTAHSLAEFPRAVLSMGAVALVSIAFVLVFFKELRIAAFDPELATSSGFNATLLHFVLMGLVAVAAVSAFEAVGSILVIAMLICPAATARLLTDRLGSQLLVSIVVAITTAVGGYILATRGPMWVGAERSVSAAGMMAVTGGALLTMTIFAAPRHGVIAKQARRAALALRVKREDLLARLYRLEEAEIAPPTPPTPTIPTTPAIYGPMLALWSAARRGEITKTGDRIELTNAGRQLALSIVRSHRLWESYLVDEVGLRPDHVHDTAMELEHLRRATGERYEPEVAVDRDPHGKRIPKP